MYMFFSTFFKILASLLAISVFFIILFSLLSLFKPNDKNTSGDLKGKKQMEFRYGSPLVTDFWPASTF